MADLNKTIKDIERCLSRKSCYECGYYKTKDIGKFEDHCRNRMLKDALELLKEPRKTKDEILFAIVSAIGYESVDAFKETAEEVGSLDEFMIGMNRSIDAVKKLFAKDGEQK